MRFTAGFRSPLVASLLPFALAGSACRPAPPESAVVRVEAPPAGPGSAVPPSPSAAQPKAAAFHLPSNGVVPEGCFAWSPRTHAAACTIGVVGNNMPGTGDTFHAEWRVVFLGDPGARPVDLVPAPPAGSGFFRIDAPPAAGPRGQLDTSLAAGGYVELAPQKRRLSAGAPLAWAGAEIVWTRRSTSPGGENQAPRYTDTIAIRWAPGGALTPIETREDAPVESPEYAVYLVPGERFAVVSDVAGYGDEGVAGLTVSAFRCDRVARRCE